MESFITLLKKRFDQTAHLHQSVDFETIESFLRKHQNILEKAQKLEEQEGNVHIVSLTSGVYLIDLYEKTPKSRANVCYDKEARISRKKYPPTTSALELCEAWGVNLLDEDMYLELQSLIDIDLTTSSWLLTEPSVRSKGGALFGDKRFSRTFIYHNGADSYYGVRGFRCFIKLFD